MRIEWLPGAQRDLASQIAYIGRRNPRAAVAVGDAIEHAVSLLDDHPELAGVGRVPGTRELVVNGTPYVVVYRLEPDTILILRVLHGAQDWPSG